MQAEGTEEMNISNMSGKTCDSQKVSCLSLREPSDGLTLFKDFQHSGKPFTP